MLGQGKLPSQAYKESAGVTRDLSGAYLEEPGRPQASQCVLYWGTGQEGLGV